MSHPDTRSETILIDADNPWPGLAAFRERDEAYFYGRETEADDLYRLVVRERLGVLLGKSGLGKTSLIQAGLFPRLRREQMLPVYVRIRYGDADPSFGTQLMAALEETAKQAGIECPSRRPDDTLWEAFHRKGADFWSARNRPIAPLLVFDQFEEIFTLGRSTQSRADRSSSFLADLADLVEGRPSAEVKARLDKTPTSAAEFIFERHSYRVLLCLREDFLPELEAYRASMPSIVHNRLRLEALNGERAFRALRSAGGPLLDENAAEQIIRFVGADASGGNAALDTLTVEPSLLSVVCRELNNRRRERGEAVITTSLLEGSRAEVLSSFYERSFSDVDAALRNFVEERLLTVSGYRDSVALENALTSPGIKFPDIERLVDRRILRLDEFEGVGRVELTHDVLASVARESRDRRRAAEAAAAAEAALKEQQELEHQARVAAEERARRASLQLRRSRSWSAILFVLLVAAAFLGVDAWQQRKRVSAALADSRYRQARNLVAMGRAGEALAYLASSARLHPNSEPTRRLLTDLLFRRNWARPIAAFRHQSNTVSIAESRDGRRVLTASWDKTARIWDLKTGQPVGQPLRHKAAVVFASFSPDDRLVVTASEDYTARMWDAATSAPVGQPLNHTDHVRRARFSPDGRIVVTVCEDKTVQFWDVSKGVRLGEPLRSDDRVIDADFSPDGSVVLSGGGNVAALWDVQTRRLVTKLSGHKGMLWDGAFSHDGKVIGTASADQTARLWDATNGRPIGSSLQHNAGVTSVAFLPDGKRLVTTTLAGDYVLWDVESQKQLGSARFFGPNAVGDIEINPKNGLMLSQILGGKVWIQDVGRWETLGEPLWHQGLEPFAQFSPDGHHVLTSTEDGRARVWAVPLGKSLQRRTRYSGRLLAIEDCSDGPRALVLTATGEIEVRDTWERKLNRLPLRVAWDQPDRGVATLSSDCGLALARNGASVSVFDLSAKDKAPIRLDAGSDVTDASFSGDGRRLITVSTDRVVRVWDSRTGNIVRGHHLEAEVGGAHLSMDGSQGVATLAGGHATVWNVASDQERFRLTHEGVDQAKFSPTNDRLLTSSSRGSVMVWRSDGTPSGVPVRPGRLLRDAGFSRDGRSMFITTQDGVTVWDLTTGEQLGDTIPANWPAVRFSRDGNRLYGVDGQVVMSWELWTPPSPGTSELAALAEALSGARIDDAGRVAPVDEPVAELDQIRQRSASGADAIAKLINWFFSSDDARPISPHAEIGISEFIRALRNDGDEEGVAAARLAYPHHPLFQEKRE